MYFVQYFLFYKCIFTFIISTLPGTQQVPFVKLYKNLVFIFCWDVLLLIVTRNVLKQILLGFISYFKHFNFGGLVMADSRPKGVAALPP